MKKVLMVSSEGLGNGGVQAVMMSIVRNINDKYIFDVLLFTNEKRHYDNEFCSYGGNIYRIPKYEGNNLLRKKIDYYIRGYYIYKNVLKLLKYKGPYDVVHCHNEYESALILKAASLVGIPIRIVHTHIISQKVNLFRTLFNYHRKKDIEKYATNKVGCSREACESFYLNDRNCNIIYNTFNENKFNINKYDLMNKKEFIILQVARFSPIKNQLFSIQILKKIKEQYPNVRLNLVGFSSPDYQELIKKEINKYELIDNVIFYPSDTDTAKLLSESAAFILPSLHEGFGIVLIEAQAMGVHCYASDVVPQITNAGGVTYLSLADGADIWANKIIDDYVKYEGAYQLYNISEFAPHTVMKKIEYLYEGKLF